MVAKNAKVGKSVAGQKTPCVVLSPDSIHNAPIAWNFRWMDDSGEWKCSIACLEEFKDGLISFEGKPVNTIFQRGNHRHSHPMSIKELCHKARKRLDVLNIDTSTLHQLDLAQKPRLWGVLHHNIFHIIWIDREHTVYPSSR